MAPKPCSNNCYLYVIYIYQLANEQLGGRRLMDVLRLLAVFQSFSDRFWLAKRRRYAGELSFCVKRHLAKKRRFAVHPTVKKYELIGRGIWDIMQV